MIFVDSISLAGGTIKPLSESEIEQVKLWFQAAFYKPVFPPCPDKATLKAWLQRCPTTRNLLVNSPENAYAVKYAVKAIEVELRQVKDKVRKQLQGKGSYGRWLRLPLSDLTEKIVGEVNHICDVEAAKGRIAFFRHVCDNYLAEDRGAETPERGQVRIWPFLHLSRFSIFFLISFSLSLLSLHPSSGLLVRHSAPVEGAGSAEQRGLQAAS